MSRPILASLFIAAALVSLSTVASADGNDARAREAFQQGLDHFKSGRAAQACPLFAEAYRADPKLGYVVNLARCEAKLGQLVASSQHWKDALALATSTNDERRAEVERGVESSTHDLPHVIVEVPPADGAKIAIDDRPSALDVAAKGVPVDIGTHRVVVTLRDRVVHAVDVQVKNASELVTVRVPATALATPPASEARAASLAPAEPPAADSRRGDTTRLVGIGIGGAGLGVLALGAYAALRASAKNNDSKSECPHDACTDRGFVLRSDATASAELATAAFVAGGTLAAAGIVVYLVAPRATGRPGPHARLVPRLGGAAFEGAF